MPIINGSFEAGFTGWNIVIPPGASAITTSSYSTYLPIYGSMFALLKTDGAGNYTTISQSFTAQAGERICGWAFFDAEDYLPYNDNAHIYILSGVNIIATPFYADVSTVGDYGQTPWTFWQYQFTSPGVYTIEAGIANGGDSGVDSYMGIDGVQLGFGPCRGIKLY